MDKIEINFRFLHNKKNGHYALIYKENKKNYFYFGLTHAKRFFNNKNLKLSKNPNPKDNRNAYIIPKISHLNKSYFKDTAKHLVLSEEDKVQLINLIEKKK